MKKITLILIAIISLSLTGCLEVTEEITLNEDGSGNYVNISDMSKVIPIVKNMGVSNQMGDNKLDTLITLGNDGTEGLSAEDVAMLKSGTLKIKKDVDEEQFVGTLNIPFKSLDEIPKINRLTSKSLISSLMKMMAASPNAPQLPPGMGNMESSSIGDYYQLDYSNGELKRKINKEKYAALASDKVLEQLQQLAGMGVPVTYKTIFKLPKPAEKVEGKNAKLSDDKKTVTVSGTIDELYDHPENMEFKVKY